MKKPIVAIVMGSDSDLPVMKESVAVMEEFQIPYEVMILSAHRCPEETARFAGAAFEKGIKVIIAGAGGAAHLAGVIAAHFPLSVIGIPIKTPALSGVDSLYSIVQMPPGIPVATVGINGAKNAGLLAVQILAVNDNKLGKGLKTYKANLAKTALAKSDKLRRVGVKNYLESVQK